MSFSIIHGCVLLVTKDDTVMRHAFAIALGASRAPGLLLVAFDLVSAARKTVVSVSVRQRGQAC